ncbi:MAG: glycosyltransferase [Verrucomicrobia bacterium]|nr:glycosyltransferase [Verrucomicrobiota bacterium]MCH8511012.1 glycosyltransferase [Kiritimatiellia bacterium]
MELSILIPAYNEAQRIAPTLEDYATATSGRSTEVIVIVNGSSDETADLVRKEFLPRFAHLRLVEISDPVGKGGALMRGMAESQGQKIGFTDADGSVPAEAFLHLADSLREEGIVIGSRWLPDSHVSRKQPLPRLVSSRFFNALVRLYFGFKVTDTQCGAKILTRNVMESILPRLGATQWAFDVDLLFQIRRAGFPIEERPTVWRDVDGSKVHYFRTSMEMFLAVTRLRMLHSPLKFLVRCWDQTLGVRLFERRAERMRSIYKGTRFS